MYFYGKLMRSDITIGGVVYLPTKLKEAKMAKKANYNVVADFKDEKKDVLQEKWQNNDCFILPGSDTFNNPKRKFNSISDTYCAS
jgi:hypothetical protein